MNSPPGYDAQGLELPQPDAAAIAHSCRLIEAIVERIDRRGGAIGFDEYMQMALYEPGLGYYSSNTIKFGAPGDFVTAPEISPLFGYCLARQAEALFAQGLSPGLLEFGAGSGRLCAHLLDRLPSLERYFILDLSAELKQRQQAYLQSRCAPELVAKVEWLNALPENFAGLVLASEVLDAMPVQRLQKRGQWVELGVGYDGARFCWQTLTPASGLRAAIAAIENTLGELPQAYCCEINLNYRPWFAALAANCREAAVVIVDYGFERHEYFHPARPRGLLECFYRHRLHGDPLILPGLQDITAYVDFDACADAAETCGFEIAGLVSQQSFLLANGLLEEAERRARDADLPTRLALAQQVKTLSMAEEMGTDFKILAMFKNLSLEMPAMSRRSARG